MNELDTLYQELILEHYKHPRNREPLEGDFITHENPSCGDSLRLKIEWEGSDRIKRIVFDGHGCAISIASASIMTELLSGETVQNAERICTKAIAFLRGESKASTDAGDSSDSRHSGDPVDLGDLQALAGVRLFPLRVKCATLAWHGIEKELKAQGEVDRP